LCNFAACVFTESAKKDTNLFGKKMRKVSLLWCLEYAGEIGRENLPVGICAHQGKALIGALTPAVRMMRVDDNNALSIGLKKTGIEDFRFHDLRHTWASWLIQSGVPLSVLQEMGGWESIEMVRRYAHLAPNHLSEHARKIDVIFGNNDTNVTQGGNQAGLKLA